MNPFYNQFQQQQQSNIPARPANLGDILNAFASRFIPQGFSAEQYCRQLIQNNQMTQEQFEQYSKIADAWTKGGRV